MKKEQDKQLQSLTTLVLLYLHIGKKLLIVENTANGEIFVGRLLTNHVKVAST